MCGNGVDGSVFSLWSGQEEQDMKSHELHMQNSWGYWQGINSLRCSVLVIFLPPNLLLKKVDTKSPMKGNSCTPFSMAAHRKMFHVFYCVTILDVKNVKASLHSLLMLGARKRGLLCRNGLSQLFWQVSQCCFLSLRKNVQNPSSFNNGNKKFCTIILA